MSRTNRRRIWVHRRNEHPLESGIKGWPERPTWLVELLAPGIDYFVIAGFPTHSEAIKYADQYARRKQT